MNKNKKTQEEFELQVFYMYGDEYLVLGEYKSNKKKIEIFHKKCKISWHITPNNFLRRHGCPNCSGLTKKTTEIFKSEIKNVHGDEYSVVDEYKGRIKKIKIQHNKCGFIFSMTPKNVLDGHGCPECARNKTESKLAKELKEYFSSNYSAISEYRELNSPTSGKSMPYDIYIPEYKIYVEVQGQQHYKEYDGYYKGEFKKIQKRDQIKKKHAQANGIYVAIDIRKYDFKKSVEFIEGTIKNQLGKTINEK